MGLTNFPNGLTSFGVPVLPGISVPYYGNYWFVNEASGLDGNSGKSPSQAFKTLTQAQLAATANQNDVVFFTGTIHVTSSVLWAKNQVHLVGVDSPLTRGKRARVSVTGATAFSNLVNVSASGCHFQNFGTFYGFNSASNNDVCWLDTGGRNCYENVEFMGFGDNTASTGTANIVGARSFVFNNSTGESTWRNCVFGVDTTQRNATNYTLEIAGGAPRLYFESCTFESFLGSSGTAASHILVGASGIDRYIEMNDCKFLSAVKSTGSTMAQSFNLNAAIGGFFLLNRCWQVGVTKLETSATNQIYVNNAAVTATANQGINNT